MFGIFCLLLGVSHFADSTLVTCPPPSEGRTIRRLKSSLLCDYDSMERPVKNSADNVTVKFHLLFKHIAFADYQSKISMSVYIWMEWYDEFLQWDPKNYNNISKIFLHPDQVWFPDIFMLSGDIQTQDLRKNSKECKLKHSGIIECMPLINTELYCLQNLINWPFDKQLCEFGFASFTDPTDIVQFQLYAESGGFNKNFLNRNNEWKVTNVSADQFQTLNDKFLWSNLYYAVEIERHASLYAVTIIAQAFVMSAITLLSFWVSGIVVRTCLCCTALLGNSLCLLYIGSRISASGTSSPNIAVFFRDSMIMTVVALAVGFCVENLRNKTTNMRAPTWLVSGVSCLDRRGGRMGQLLLGDSEVEKEEGNEENDIARTTLCSNFATLLNRLTFLTLIITYSIMLAALLP